MSFFPTIEVLEDRIAPAQILNPYTIVYQDSDGDAVKLKLSKPLFISDAFANSFLGFSAGSVDGTTTTPQSLLAIDFTGLGKAMSFAQGVNIDVSVTPKAGVGDGQANVGEIIAASTNSDTYLFTNNIDLGSINIQGDLGMIVAGDSLSSPAIKSLTVHNFGTWQGQVLMSQVLGPITKLHTTGDFLGYLQMYGAEFGSIGTLQIDGALKGTAGVGNSGYINFSGNIGTAKIGSIIGADGKLSGALKGVGNNRTLSTINSLQILSGGIKGSSGDNSGFVWVGKIGNLKVVGDITGGSGVGSGFVSSTTQIGTVQITGNLVGGSANSAGLIQARQIPSLTIGGSIIGGTGESTGAVMVGGSLGNMHVGGNVTGASSTSQIIAQSGFISANHIGSLIIDGSLVAGSKGGSFAILDSGAIRAGQDIGIIAIRGDLRGDATNPAIISAGGFHGVTATTKTDVAINQISIGGNMTYGTILAGYTDVTQPTSPIWGIGNDTDAQINSVKIGGNLTASNIVAGVSVGDDKQFGTSDDSAIFNLNYTTGHTIDSAQVISKISSIIVGGQVTADPSNTSGQFGIVAQQVVAMTVNGQAVSLNSGPFTDRYPGKDLGGNTRVIEVAPGFIL